MHLERRELFGFTAAHKCVCLPHDTGVVLKTEVEEQTCGRMKWGLTMDKKMNYSSPSQVRSMKYHGHGVSKLLSYGLSGSQTFLC